MLRLRDLGLVEHSGVARCITPPRRRAAVGLNEAQYQRKSSEQSVSRMVRLPVLTHRIDESVERGIPLTWPSVSVPNGRSCAVK